MTLSLTESVSQSGHFWFQRYNDYNDYNGYSDYNDYNNYNGYRDSDLGLDLD